MSRETYDKVKELVALKTTDPAIFTQLENLSDQQITLLQALLVYPEYDIEQCLKKVLKISKKQYPHYMLLFHDRRFQEIYKKLKISEIEILEANASKAAKKLSQLMDHEDPSVQLKSAIKVLEFTQQYKTPAINVKVFNLPVLNAIRNKR
ncbi:MAG: hypothetical protein ACPL1H_06875 [bacterium]